MEEKRNYYVSIFDEVNGDSWWCKSKEDAIESIKEHAKECDYLPNFQGGIVIRGQKQNIDVLDVFYSEQKRLGRIDD